MSENKPGLIYEKIPLIMEDIRPIGKSQYNQQQRFNFRGIDDIYNHCQNILAKHKVFTIPEIIGRHRETVSTKSGGRAYHCVNQYKFHFIASDGSSVAAWTDGEAMDMGDKASNKCAAIAHKYALLQVFCIPTAEIPDPDSESPQLGGPQSGQSPVHHQKPALPDPRKVSMVSDGQLKRLYALKKTHGVSDQAVARLINGTYGINSENLLNMQQYGQVCDWVKAGGGTGGVVRGGLASEFI